MAAGETTRAKVTSTAQFKPSTGNFLVIGIAGFGSSGNPLNITNGTQEIAIYQSGNRRRSAGYLLVNNANYLETSDTGGYHVTLLEV